MAGEQGLRWLGARLSDVPDGQSTFPYYSYHSFEGGSMSFLPYRHNCCLFVNGCWSSGLISKCPVP
jgi:hypothetical protein